MKYWLNKIHMKDEYFALYDIQIIWAFDVKIEHYTLFGHRLFFKRKILDVILTDSDSEKNALYLLYMGCFLNLFKS